MRFLRLDLTAYGRFAGESLDLSSGNSGVHLVFGRNEAGKSTLLRAIKALLFGIKNERNGDQLELGFRHGSENLRIGALLADRNGTQLEVVRRKGGKNSLRGADDETRIEEGQLQALLNIDQRQFSQQFGLSYDELVQGGQAIAAGKGDVGEILFAAATGLANLRAVQRALNAESEALFTPSARNRPINKGISDLKDLRKRVSDLLLSADDWQRKNEEVETAQRHKQELQDQAADIASRLAKTEAYLHAHPDLQRLDQLLTELTELGDVPLLPVEFGPARVKIAQELASSEAALTGIDRELASTKADIASLPASIPLLGHKGELLELVQQQGACRKAASDRTKRLGEQDQLKREIVSLQRELGEYQQLQSPPRATRKRLEQLADEASRLQQTRETLERQIGHLESEASASAPRNPVRERGAPPATLLDLLKRARAECAHGARLDQLAQELEQLERQCQAERQRLRPAMPAEAAAGDLPVPSLDSIEHHEQARQDLQSERKRQQQTVGELQTRLAEQTARIQSLRHGAEVPSLQDLQQARVERERTWQQLREDWTSIATKPIVFRELTGQFERQVARADDLADRLRRDAAQVAELAAAETAANALNRQLEIARERIAEVDQSFIDAEKQWNDLWLASGVVPLSPREMRGWLARLASLQQLQQTSATKLAELRLLTNRQAELSGELRESFISEQLPRPAATATLVQWLAHAEQEVSSWQEQHQLGLQAAQTGADRQQQLQRLRSELKSLDHRLANWSTEWSELLTPLGLPADVGPAIVRELVQVREEIQQKENQEQLLEERIKAIDKDQSQFRDALRKFAAIWLESPADEMDESLLAQLQTQLTEAERSAARLQDQRDRLARLTTQQQEAKANVEQLQARLRQMCKDAGCPNADELPKFIERSDRRRQGEDERRQVEQRLLSLAGSTPLGEFVAAAKLRGSDQLRADQLRGKADAQNSREELMAASERAGELASERSRWQGADDAAAAEQDAQCLLTQIRDQSEQYIRLRLAAAMLRKAVETWRDSNQDPVLKRASELFARLTLGSFEGIRSDLNDDGETVLVGVRAGKDAARELVPIGGLSSGTCDQLYLAIRLASLEVQLKHREPLPVIVDDCLINFDDDRSRAALQALGELSRTTQVIMLTHHERIVELAQSSLDKSVLFVHRLGV